MEERERGRGEIVKWVRVGDRKGEREGEKETNKGKAQ